MNFTVYPQLECCIHESGWMVITCFNQSSHYWTKMALPRIKAEGISRVKIVEKNDLPVWNLWLCITTDLDDRENLRSRRNKPNKTNVSNLNIITGSRSRKYQIEGQEKLEKTNFLISKLSHSEDRENLRLREIKTRWKSIFFIRIFLWLYCIY